MTVAFCSNDIHASNPPCTSSAYGQYLAERGMDDANLVPSRTYSMSPKALLRQYALRVHFE